MASKREISKRQTGERIYTTAMELFAEHGYDNVSMNDIARESGVSRATLFNYVGQKENILVLYNQSQAAALEEFEAGLTKDLPTYEALRTLLMQDLYTIFASRRFGSVVSANTARFPDLMVQRAASRDRFADVLQGRIERGQEMGDVDAGASAFVMARTIRSHYFYVIENSFTGGWSDDEIRGFILDGFDCIWNGMKA